MFHNAKVTGGIRSNPKIEYAMPPRSKLVEERKPKKWESTESYKTLS
jgi:hypothetical protein